MKCLTNYHATQYRRREAMKNTVFTAIVIAGIVLLLILCGCPTDNHGTDPEEGELITEGEASHEGEIIVEGENANEGEDIIEGETANEGEAAGDFHLQVVFRTEQGGLYEAFLWFVITKPLVGVWTTVDGETIDNAAITRMGINVYAQINGFRLGAKEWPISQYGTYFDWLDLGEGPLFAEPYVITSDGKKAYTGVGTKWTYDSQSLIVWEGFILLNIYGPVTLETALAECDWCSAVEGEN